jgi:ketose-bisphosphate aldolase
MTRRTTAEIVRQAWRKGIVVPGFNVPYLPMMTPVVQALRDAGSFGLVMVARPDWVKFEAGGLQPVRDEYERVKDERHTRLHLDHVPVIDEDGQTVDYEQVIGQALDLGYESVMVDASRLPLAENIAATRRIVQMARPFDAAVEAELGAVLGHEEGPLPPYEELFASGKGFTDPEEAGRFARESGCDWLSVAIGNIHGAISLAKRHEKKAEAMLNLEHLDRIRRLADLPLVLHGGSGIRKSCLLESFRRGVAKINVGTAIRQPYEQTRGQSVGRAREAVYQAMRRVLRDELEIEGSAAAVNPG